MSLFKIRYWSAVSQNSWLRFVWCIGVDGAPALVVDALPVTFLLLCVVGY